MSIFKWQSKDGNIKKIIKDGYTIRATLTIYKTYDEWKAKIILLKPIKSSSILYILSPVRKEYYEETKLYHIDVDRANKIFEKVVVDNENNT